MYDFKTQLYKRMVIVCPSFPKAVSVYAQDLSVIILVPTFISKDILI